MKLIMAISFLIFYLSAYTVCADQWAFSEYNSKEDTQEKRSNKSCSDWNKWQIGNFPLTVVIDRNLHPILKEMALAGISEWNNTWYDYRFNLMSFEERISTPRSLFTHCDSPSYYGRSCNQTEFSWRESMIFFTENNLPIGKLGQTELRTRWFSNYYDTILVTMRNNRRISWFYDTDFFVLNKVKGFDYFTTVVHELGHVLGLRHNSRSKSVMFPRLKKGEAKRNVTYEDIKDFLCIYYNDFMRGT